MSLLWAEFCLSLPLQIHMLKSNSQHLTVWLYLEMGPFKGIIQVTKPFPGGSDSKESGCNERDLGLILRPGSSPGKGNGNPLQYSFFVCLFFL